MNECSFRKMYNNTSTETKAKGESRRWTYRTKIRSQIDILIQEFSIIINRVNGDSAVERAASFLLERGASIQQRRLKVLSEPCNKVTHHTALTQTQPVVDPGRQSKSA